MKNKKSMYKWIEAIIKSKGHMDSILIVTTLSRMFTLKLAEACKVFGAWLKSQPKASEPLFRWALKNPRNSQPPFVL